MTSTPWAGAAAPAPAGRIRPIAMTRPSPVRGLTKVFL